MARNTRSSLRLILLIVALAMMLGTETISPAGAASPPAPDFTFDKRVMLKSAYDSIKPCAGASDSLIVPYGAELVYCFLFTNTGTTTFKVHTLEDAMVGGFFEYAQDIPPGGRIIIPAFPPNPATADVTNTATWYATDESGMTVTRTDSATVKVLAHRVFLPVVLN